MRWLKNILKINKKHMISEEQLIAYQQNFSGQRFQWIKTDKIELIGKVVKVRDIQIHGNNVIAIFDDGSQVDIKDINNKLLMIHGQMEPLSLDEVKSIYGQQDKKPKVENIADTSINNKNNIQLDQSVVNPFSMFNSDETELTITVKVKLPDKKLLKMMYANAENKEIFIEQLSNYVNSMINSNVVSNSIVKILDSKATATPTSKRSEIHLVEVNEK